MFLSSDWNTGADWDSGSLKGTCSPGYAVNGLSSNAGGGAHKVICRSPGPTDIPATAQVITGLAVPGDARRATRTINNGQSDWAPGFYKLECGVNEFVSGVSQSPSGSHAFHGIRCSGPSGFTDSACFTRTLGTSDERFTQASNDWDVGFVKAECGINSYVAGVSASPSTGRANSILCCSRTPGVIF